MNTHAAIDADISRRVEELEARYPHRLSSGPRDVRVALAFVEDEVDEAKRAWRRERNGPTWSDTYSELLDVAACTVRALQAIRS